MKSEAARIRSTPLIAIVWYVGFAASRVYLHVLSNRSDSL